MAFFPCQMDIYWGCCLHNELFCVTRSTSVLSFFHDMLFSFNCGCIFRMCPHVTCSVTISILRSCYRNVCFFILATRRINHQYAIGMSSVSCISCHIYNFFGEYFLHSNYGFFVGDFLQRFCVQKTLSVVCDFY